MTTLLDLTKLPEEEKLGRFIEREFPGAHLKEARTNEQVAYNFSNREFQREETLLLIALCDKFFEKYDLKFTNNDYTPKDQSEPTIFSRMYMKDRDYSGTAHTVSALLHSDKNLTLLLSPQNVMYHNYEKERAKRK